jgi:hypothetical protein
MIQYLATINDGRNPVRRYTTDCNYEVLKLLVIPGSREKGERRGEERKGKERKGEEEGRTGVISPT